MARSAAKKTKNSNDKPVKRKYVKKKLNVKKSPLKTKNENARQRETASQKTTLENVNKSSEIHSSPKGTNSKASSSNKATESNSENKQNARTDINMYKSKEKDWLYDELIPLLRVSQCRQTRWHTKDGKSNYQSLRDYKFFKKDQINYALRRFAPGELPHRVGYLRMEPETMKLLQSAKETITFFVLQGSPHFWINNHEIKLTTSETISIPQGIMYGIRNMENENILIKFIVEG